MADTAVSFSGGATVTYMPEDGPPYWGCYKTDGSWDYPVETINAYWGYSKTPPEAIKQAMLKLC